MPPQSSKQKWLIISVCGIIAVIFVLYISRGPVYHALNALDLIPQDEHFTELYFEDHTDLPRAIFKGETIQFSFTIHNLEGATTTYPYVVYFDNGQNQIIFDQATTTIADNATTTVIENYTFKTSPDWQEIFVSLTGRNQVIHFKLGTQP